MEWCRFMSRHLKEIFLPSEWAFNLLYTFPACYIGKNDQKPLNSTEDANPQMVPFLDDPVVNMLEQGYIKDPIDE
ncbi:hypothetical protein TNCV_3200751 [Trichonephila clavipes]|nr:hypothetical protein TNCV_3200751 [Trichonephila clavipes]